MTERFTLQYIDEPVISANLFDNETFIASVSIGGELLVEVLNQLVEENKQLKKELEEIREERHKEFMIGNGW